LNRRTVSTSSRNSVTSAVLLVLNLRRMIRRQARHWARTPFSVRGVGARNWAVAVVARALFIVPLTATVTKKLNLSGSVLETQTARTAALGKC
jgi:hypothetical protein